MVCMLLLCLLISSIKAVPLVKADNGITKEKFVVMLVKELDLADTSVNQSEILKLAYAKGIVKQSEKPELKTKLTNEYAAVYLDRADKLVNGTNYDKELYQIVLNRKRLSDLKKIKKCNRASAVRMYCKGIMTGYSNGYYVQSRKFKGDKLVTAKEAKNYLARLKNVKMRRAISSDGQLIRVTNLPKNYKSYPYILETYPNSFYERKFEYQKTKYGKKPVELVDYASPAKIGKMKFYNGMDMSLVMDKNLADWCDKVEQNIKLRFNVDYRKIDNNWVNQLRSTYYVFEGDAQANKQRTDDIKDYVAMVKKNKVVVKCSRVTVEPSTIYNCGEDFIRVYVKFKVVKGDVKTLQNTLYCENAIISNIRKNAWKECYFDIALGSSNGMSNGEDYAVFENMLINIK